MPAGIKTPHDIRTNRLYIQNRGDRRGDVFENFLRSIKHSDADTISPRLCTHHSLEQDCEHSSCFEASGWRIS